MGIKQAKRKAAEDRATEKKIKIMEKNTAEGEKRGAEFKRANVLQEETNTLSKIDVALKSDQMEVTIMEKDLNTLTDDYAKEYFTKRKKAIITKMREQELKESQSTSQETEDQSEPLPQNEADPIENEEGDATLTAVEDLIDPIVMNDLV
ncbi:hypothetical protein PGT21_018032 [Puccinia graminis f. sp. tritici]|uniref:No apical meristem-associated C-terminal domain-containing protein n=1 Tax=Puccinia graminis f. sp. tritici TaxID=56615 RepID=A0A5B0RL90_PUCGR|nr:hypothetical protein PGT21_018032 [Puccinia graminis f. sp. tritici]KAA1126052.1 hypothetical protein PGTUg99_018272 [Puccinia graminis f. sp. tritici]